MKNVTEQKIILKKKKVSVKSYVLLKHTQKLLGGWLTELKGTEGDRKG